MARRSCSIWLLILIGAPLAGGDGNSGLDVTRVALFSSGVAFFEREAIVSDDARAELKFRTEQINDILKSLVVQDLDGGTVGVVGYASRDPIEKTLRSFGVDLTGKPRLGQLLDQLRGEPIEISGPRKMEGIILGVEQHRIKTNDTVIDIDILNILTDDGMQQLRLAELQGIKLSDKKIDGELRKALAALASAHNADKKSVVLHFNGKGERRVRVSYVLEAPIWKTSYRLVLSDDGKPFLQGWATVENATEEDWKDVKLSLISGRPISFRMDLYTPLYVPRPLEKLELYASLRAPDYEGDFDDEPPAPVRKRAREARRSLAVAEESKAFAGIGGERFKAALPVVIELAHAGVASVASAQEAGELFEYTIQTPVSIARQHSAMLPIVNEEIDGEKVSIFNPASHPKHPLNGLQITNTTALHLMQGPVTLFDANVYAGDAKLPDLKPNEKRLIAYALDLAAEVMVERKSHPDLLVSLRVVKGILWHKHKYVDERTYRIKNKSDKDKSVIIEQAYTHDWKLLEPKEPFEKTPNLLRFKVAVAAGETVSQTVQLERIIAQSVALSSLSTERIRMYLRGPTIAPDVRKALEQAIVLQIEFVRAKRLREALEKGHAEARTEQERLRRNLGSLPRNTDSYRRQMTKFDAAETEIEEVREKLRAARKDEENRREALETYLLALNVG